MRRIGDMHLVVFQAFLDFFDCSEGAKRLNREGCAASLQGFFARKLVIDLDCCSAHGIMHDKRCDFIVFAERENGDAEIELVVVAIELTKRRLLAGKVVPQLKAGARIAEGALRSCLDLINSQYSGVRFYSVAAVGGKIHPAERELLTRHESRIEFRLASGVRPVGIRVRRCGGRLREWLHGT